VLNGKEIDVELTDENSIELKIDTDEYDDEDHRQPVNPSKSNPVEKPKNPATFSSGMNTNQRQTNIKSVLPPPPPLYKAPVTKFHGPGVFGSSANSSILARASGMNNNLLKNNMSMPKLQPIGAIKTSPSNEGNKMPANPKPDMASLMPKLKPSSYNQAGSSQQPINRTAKAILPKPPQLIMAPSAKSLINKNISEHKPVVTPVVQKQQQQPPPLQQQATATSKSPQKQTASTSNNSTKTGKNSENLSLKCKFCFEVFKGQSEFFQHVIISHPKMLEQRLNRASTTTSTAAANTSKKSNLNSNGNSNGSSNGKSQEHEEQETINRPASKSHVV